VLGAGFAGGIAAQKHFGTSSTSSGFPGLAALRGAGGLGGANAASTGGSGGLNPFGTGNATVGTVVLVDGSTVYVNTSNGIVKVATTSSTKVSVTESGTAAQLKPGQSIVVQGSKSSNGNVSATSISEGGLGTGGTGAGPSTNG
jgi:ferric-dicitrate binding protein FerR (iron transport regulator)